MVSESELFSDGRGGRQVVGRALVGKGDGKICFRGIAGGEFWFLRGNGFSNGSSVHILINGFSMARCRPSTTTRQLVVRMNEKTYYLCQKSSNTWANFAISALPMSQFCSNFIATITTFNSLRDGENRIFLS